MDVTQALPLLGGISPQVFMKRYWQKSLCWLDRPFQASNLCWTVHNSLNWQPMKMPRPAW